MGRPTARIITALPMITALAMLLAMLLGGPARAAPPTVTPSPGYDARLQESRKATATTSDPLSLPPNPPVVPPRHPRRTHSQH